jgi:hypothetical protein
VPEVSGPRHSANAPLGGLHGADADVEILVRVAGRACHEGDLLALTAAELDEELAL